tara:strand:+ start:71923 stop:72564 length:642 start_codon:yes stop_codon:yes gene_type:complete
MAKAKKTAPKKTPAKAKATAKAKPAVKAKPKAAQTKQAKPKAAQTKPAPKSAAKKTAKPGAKAKVSTKAKTTTKTPAKKAMPKKAAPKAPAKPAAKTTLARAATTPTDKKTESYFKSYLKPLDDRIVVLVGANERVTSGGLIIPDTVTDVSGNFQGKVMAIGRGHMNKKGRVQPLDVALGDKVVFSQFAGSQIDVDGNNIMIIRESDVLGIVK